MNSITKNAGLPLHFVDDLYNESLAEVWKMDNQGQKITNFNNFFIFHIFKRNALNLAQKEKLRITIDVSDWTNEDFGHKNLIEQNVTKDHIDFFLNKIDPTCRKIIEYFRKGFTNEEISKEMQLKKSTIESYKSKCFDKFESLISAYL